MTTSGEAGDLNRPWQETLPRPPGTPARGSPLPHPKNPLGAPALRWLASGRAKGNAAAAGPTLTPAALGPSRRLFGIKCAKCQVGFGSSDLVMRARDSVYHIECFRCSVCSRQLLPGDEFSLREHELLCRADHGLLLERAAAGSPRSPGPLPGTRSLHLPGEPCAGGGLGGGFSPCACVSRVPEPSGPTGLSLVYLAVARAVRMVCPERDCICVLSLRPQIHSRGSSAYWAVGEWVTEAGAGLGDVQLGFRGGLFVTVPEGGRVYLGLRKSCSAQLGVGASSA